MLLFWTLAAALSAAAAGLILARAKRAEGRAVTEDPALAVHRRQLAEIDDLVARGLLGENEREAARAEAGRRLLHAADEARPLPTSSGGRKVALAAAAVLPLAAVGAYLFLGAPGEADAPVAARVEAWRKSDLRSLEPLQLVAVREAEVGERPDDPASHAALGAARLWAGDALGASKALRQAVALAPDEPVLWTLLGEVFVNLSGGEVGPDARQAFTQAYRLDPQAISPRYHLGLALIEDGRVGEGLSAWRSLLADTPPSDPRRADLAQRIEMVEKAGGIPQAPPAGAEPDAAAIEGMVAGLAARLEEQPDDPEGWVRLVRAYAVLGRTADRDRAVSRARRLFKDRPEVLEALDVAMEVPK
jgi:cytochrome c-type biogenesis protein CcmH